MNNAYINLFVIACCILVRPMNAKRRIHARGLTKKDKDTTKGDNGKGVGNMWSRAGMKKRFVGNDVDFATVDCEEETHQCGLFGRPDRNSTGVLVCRSFLQYTFPVCINKEDSINTDTCGCCEQSCPEPCTTSCVEGEDSVLISLPGHKRKVNVRECVTPLQSITAQLSEQAKCI